MKLKSIAKLALTAGLTFSLATQAISANLTNSNFQKVNPMTSQAYVLTNIPVNPNPTVQAPVSMVQEWDKTFALSEKVTHRKVNFVNRFGIAIVADLYIPKSYQEGQKLAAVAVSGPFGAVKEQSSGVYAMSLAEQGLVTVAFDPSYTGESGGFPRNTGSPDIYTEDFLAAVDFLATLPQVDANKIGILGVCGFGGFALNAAAEDARIHAVATSVMYDMADAMSQGVLDSYTDAQRQQIKAHLANMRTQDAQANQISYNAYYLDQDGKVAEFAPLRTVDADTPNLPPVIKEFADYYRTDRGFHPRSINSNGSWTTVMPMSYMNTRLMNYAQDIKVPTLIITGEVAHSRYFSERAFAKLSGTNDKELVIVPGANHVDLYDLVSGKLPMQKFVDFFNQKLNNN